MIANNKITAVLFDWDFTLAHTLGSRDTFSERMAYLFQQHGVNATTDDVVAALEEIKTEIQSGFLHAMLYPQEKQDIMHRYRILLERLNHPDRSYDFVYKLYSGYATLPLSLYPDVLPTLAKLKSDGYKLGILSNHSTSARKVIENCVGSYFSSDVITISEEEEIHKPNKAIFEKAVAKLQLPASACAYVGDNLHVDAVGSVQQGNFARGFWLDRRGQNDSIRMPSDTHRITSLSELPTLL
ncbi:MAG: HAD family hydrolase [Chloroflexi bacterium]|nr:HAD family hydrolase [Chloroflexota bacterium]